jgi:hypothetical protein
MKASLLVLEIFGAILLFIGLFSTFAIGGSIISHRLFFTILILLGAALLVLALFYSTPKTNDLLNPPQ